MLKNWLKIGSLSLMSAMMLSFLTYCPPKGKENTMTMAAAALAMQKQVAADAPVITGNPAALESSSGSAGAASAGASAAGVAAGGRSAPMALRGSNEALYRGMLSTQSAGQSYLKPQATSSYTWNFTTNPANSLNCYTNAATGVSYIAVSPSTLLGGTASGTASITAGTLNLTAGASSVDMVYDFSSTGIQITFSSCSLMVIDYTTIQNWDGQAATLKNYFVPVTITGTITSSGTMNFSGTIAYTATSNPNISNYSGNAAGTASSTATSSNLAVNGATAVSMNLTTADTFSSSVTGTRDSSTNTVTGTYTYHIVHDITGTIGADTVNIHFPMTYTQTY